MSKKYVGAIQKEDLTFKITDLYEKIAEIAGVEVSDTDTFDCRKVEVGEGILDTIRNIYFETAEALGHDKESATEGFSMVWVMAGPKVNTSFSPFGFEFTEGFIVNEK